MRDASGHGVNLGRQVTCKFGERTTSKLLVHFVVVLLTLFFGSTKISVPSRVQNLERVQTIAVGAFHNLALLECGEVWAWGNNEYGQLGTGDTQPRAHPVHVKGLEDVPLVSRTSMLWKHIV